ncbi:MAG TPA: HD domain-containing phosphohydrolase, partial [Desulfopila sp.]|nr:HD domain-containing phosphohydrolase [Desulfopila sp.]
FTVLNFVKFRQKEVQTKKQIEELALAQASIIEGMASLTESRHKETGYHITRTQEYVRLLARMLQGDSVYGPYIDDEMVDLLYTTAPLHDIGKVGVPDCILLKEGKLTAEEFEEIKKHPAIGKEIIANIDKKMGNHPFLQVALELVYTHHEKWNGSGYPRGLKGEEIPLAGRIMAIVDMYDALTSKRVYKEMYSHEEAITIMKEHDGTSFDPRIYKMFMDNNERFHQVAACFNDTNLPRR